ncbi:MAG: serine hydrolase [Ignavibacteria bacterium]|nr:serine hydrolase [Ignavibacteria bacterium]
MNKLFKYILLASVIFFSPLYSYSQINLMGKSIDDYILECMNRWQIPGMSVAVIEDGKVTYIKGFGVKELGKNDNVDENTLFAVASNTKAFIGTSIALLENDGKIKLDDKVQQYIPDIKLNITELSSMLSIKDILTHRTGIGTFHGDFITWGTNLTTQQLIANLRNVKPVYDFRSGYGYFNMGYVAAGEVIKAITGQKWDEFVGTNILTPLGMKRTITSITRLGEFDNIATPHSYNYDYSMTPIPWRNVDNIGPCGGIISSAADMAKWVTMQINEGKFEGKEIIPRKVILRTHTPFNLIPAPSHGTGNLSNRHFRTYGLGWGIADYKGELFLEHSGGYDGMLSRTAFMPDKKFGLVILTNNDQNDAITSLMYQLFDYAIGKETFNWDSLVFANETSNGVPYDKITWDEISDKTDPSLKSSFEMISLEGVYSNEQAGIMRIRIIGNSPQFRLSTRPGVTGILSHWRNDTLICRFSDFVLGRCLAVVTATNGKVQSIKIKAADFIDPLYYEFIRKD